MADRIYTGDSAVIEAQIFDEETEQIVVADGVTWYVQRPDGSHVIISGNPALTGYEIGARLMSRDPADNGLGTIYASYTVMQWNGTSWDNLGSQGLVTMNPDSSSTLLVPGPLTIQEGLYTTRAQFALPDNTTVSTVSTFEARDPMVIPATSGIDMAVEHAMVKLEDLFDSELGGPWLQDVTVRAFDRRKMRALLPDALYMINNSYQPVTSFDPLNFPTNHYPLVSQALLIEAILHLIRSYTEQPLPSGGNISWLDRRDYQQRWQSVMEREEARLTLYLDMFKMEYTGFGATAVLVGGYATPITRMSRYWRLSNPKYVGPWR